MKLLRLLVLLALFFPSAQPVRTRLLIIGDSLSFGLAASSEETTYRALATTALDTETARISARTLADTPQVIPDADIIILEVGLNDVLDAVPPIGEQDWPAAYGAVLDRLQAAAPLVVAATPFHALYSAHAKYEQMIRYAGYIREQATQRSIRIADLWAIDECVPVCLSQPEDYTPFPPLFHGDGFHPNDLGHWRIAQVLLRAIRGNNVYIPAFAVE